MKRREGGAAIGQSIHFHLVDVVGSRRRRGVGRLLRAYKRMCNVPDLVLKLAALQRPLPLKLMLSNLSPRVTPPASHATVAQPLPSHSPSSSLVPLISASHATTSIRPLTTKSQTNAICCTHTDP